jgi:hypothetical protein
VLGLVPGNAFTTGGLQVGSVAEALVLARGRQRPAVTVA